MMILKYQIIFKGRIPRQSLLLQKHLCGVSPTEQLSPGEGVQQGRSAGILRSHFPLTLCLISGNACIPTSTQARLSLETRQGCFPDQL